MSAARAPLVVVVTDLDAVAEPELFARLERARDLAEPARVIVQARARALPARALLGLAARLREATARLGLRLLVNDRMDLARAVAADGVHLGRLSVTVEDARAWLGGGALISVACHAPAEAAAAAEAGADLVLLSPIFASPGKAAPLGLGALAEARRALDAAGSRARLVALGGVDASNAASCLEAGAGGVAAIRADLVAFARDRATAR